MSYNINKCEHERLPSERTTAVKASSSTKKAIVCEQTDNSQVAPISAENAAIRVQKIHSPVHADVPCHPAYNASRSDS